MTHTIVRLLFPLIILCATTSLFADSFARNRFSFFTNQNGTSPSISTTGHPDVRLGIEVDGITVPFNTASIDLYGQSVNGPEIYLGNYPVPNPAGSSFKSSITVSVPTAPDMLRIAATGKGTPGRQIQVTTEFWGYFPPIRSERAVEAINDTGKLMGTNPFVSPEINLAPFNEVRIAFSVGLTSTSAFKPPTVTVFGLFGSAEVPIATIDPTKDAVAGGSVVFRSPPNRIKLKFAKAVGSTADIDVFWYIWGIPVKD